MDIMKLRIDRKVFLILIISGISLIGFSSIVSADTGMSSANYKIWADSLNLFGGDSTSTNYNLSDTGGELGTGDMTSANYKMSIGYWEMFLEPVLIFSINDTTINLGTLSSAAVTSGSTTLTTATNAFRGYVVTVREETGLKNATGYVIADVADNAVSAGSEEYGIITSGADGQLNSADTAIIATPQIVAQHDTFTDNVNTTVTFKAAISNSTEAGNYSHNVDFIATGRF